MRSATKGMSRNAEGKKDVLNMLVSIITVSWNSEESIARTVESVLNQTYDFIEYIVVDGASKDGTVAIVEGYRERFKAKGYELTVISEPDKGMYDALNKGTCMAKGELIGQINSDDWYESCAVEEMVRLYEKAPFDIAWADIRIHKSDSSFVKKAKLGRLWTTSGFCHPSMFSRKEILLKYPYACRAMDDDFDMVTRAYRDHVQISTLDRVIANYSLGGMSTDKGLKKMVSRINMKYDTYRRNGFSRLYWFYCVLIEGAKYVLA